MNTTTIFTDGSSRGNPGPGGWGAVIISNFQFPISDTAQAVVTEIGGRDAHTTNNRMELTAAIEASRRIVNSEQATINCDSSYVINGITKWVHGWKRNNWITSLKKDVENRDLWEKLLGATEGKRISWNYVGGHVGVVGNERCDEIATAFADNDEPQLYSGPFSGYGIKNILDVSRDESLSQSKKSSSTRSKAKAYSYISAINGDVKIHATWAECERRVKGVKGARFKKALNAEEQDSIVREFRK